MDGKGGKSRTDLLAAGRKKLQQYRKKKDKGKPSSKKVEAEAEVEATTEEPEKITEVAAPEPEVEQEPKSPVGLALIALSTGEASGGVDHDGKDQKEAFFETPVDGCGERSEHEIKDRQEQERSGLEHCNGDVVGHDVAMARDASLSVSEEGVDDADPSSRPEEEERGEGEVGHPSLTENPDVVSMPTEDGGEHKVGILEEGSSSHESPGLNEANNLSFQVTTADDTSNQEEAWQMDGDLKENVEPPISSQFAAEKGHEEEDSAVASLHLISDSITKEDTVEADEVGEEIVQEDPGPPICAGEEITIQEPLAKAGLSLQSKPMGEVDEAPHQEKVEADFFNAAVNEGNCLEDFEGVQKHLYLTILSRDFLQLQLDEQVGLNSEITQHSSDEVSKLQVLVKETEESKGTVHEELQQCRSELQGMVTVKKELEHILASVKEEMNASNNRCEKLEYELHFSEENLQRTLSELADCRASLQTFQKENLDRTASIAFDKQVREKLEEEREYLSSGNKKLSSELLELNDRLVNCRAALERLQKENLELTANVTFEREARENLEEEREYLFSENKKLSSELLELNDRLADCRSLERSSLETLQKENLELTANFVFEKEARKKLEEERKYLSSENKKLSLELLELNDRLLLAYDKHKQLESNIRETKTYCEQFTEQLIKESLCASSSADIYKSIIKELDDKCNVVLSQALNVVYQENASYLDPAEITAEGPHGTAPNSGVPGHVSHDRSLQLVCEKYSGDSAVFQVLKGHLEEVKGNLHDLEKLTHKICSRSDGRVLVSKLIKSFETKSNQTDTALTEGERDDLYKSTRELICRLGDKLKEMGLDLLKAEEYVVELCNRRELSTKFEMEYEAERQHNAILQGKMDELVGRLSSCKDTIDELQNRLDSVQQDADNNSRRIVSEVELLQKELTDKVSPLEHERDSLTDLISKVIDKLTSSGAMLGTDDFSDNEDLHSRTLNCVEFTTKSIHSLHEKLEAALLDNSMLKTSLVDLNNVHTDVQERSEQACGFVKKMLYSLQELLRDSYGIATEADVDENAEEPVDVLFSRYERLVQHLQNLLHDQVVSLSKSAELESRLLRKCEEVEELSIRCNSLTEDMNDILLRKAELESISSSNNEVIEELHGRCLVLAEKFGGHSLNTSSIICPALSETGGVIEKHSKENDICNFLLPYLEEAVDLHLQKYEEAVEQINLSKICLQEINVLQQISSDKWSLALPTLIKEEMLPKFCDLQDRIDQLCTLNIQLETEVPALKGALKKMEEVLETSRSELHQKVSELEQSEQKFSSVKEKLSIAVAKGKGLIVQRDSLKQSLMEKSGELEKLSQELQSKEALLKEVEAKLKSCTEVDRIEALESELSYIRNSATALRDSFLLKDSVLQRIEEVLEDLDLPEHFHSRDIVEKIEFLSRMAVGNSFPVTDGDKRLSVDGHSDSGAVVTDPSNDERHLDTYSGSDELKNKHDELQRRFYDLAEHNNILEQSLVERNNLIQKWEEVLGQISIPSQFRMLEPEVRIAWLGNRLSEVEHERDALQSKIEHLEDSSEMLIVDLEESHKRISELNAEVVAIKAEKDFFSGSMDKLRFEFLGLSDKAAQDEIERENLQKQLAGLQEKLVEKTEESKHHHEMELEVHELLNLVCNALPDGSSTEIQSGGSATEYLGKTLRKLLDEYGTLVSESTRGNVAEKEIHLEETQLSDDNSTSKTSIDGKEMALSTSRNDLDDACHNLALMKEQRDEAMEKNQSLALEIEELRTQINQLQEERTDEMQKYQSLLVELESVGRQRDTLQEQLNQEEQKCASLREKLNVAVRKGKALVQHKDSLKQAMEEMNSVMENLKNERKQHIEALESEKSLLISRLSESEKSLHDSRQYLSRLLSALNAVDVGQDVETADPVIKIEKLANLCHDLQRALASSENEVKKSKRATDLLLTELNEAQERADILQEELARADAALSASSRQKDILEAARTDSIRRLEHFMSLHSQARRKQIDYLKELNSTTGQLREVCFELSEHLINTFTKDVDLICYMESFVESSSKLMDGANMVDIPITSNHLISNSIINKKAQIPNASLEVTIDDSDESQITQLLAVACHAVSDCVRDYDDLKRSIDEHAFSFDQKATGLFKVMGNLQSRFSAQSNELESLKGEITGLQAEIREKEDEISLMCRNLSLLYEACSNSLAEIEGMAYSAAADNVREGDAFMSHLSYFDGQNQLFSADRVRSMADKLVSAIKSTRSSDEGNSKELKATIFELQQELQAKDIQISTISAELASQLRGAESVAKQLSIELEDAKTKASNLGKQIELLQNEKVVLETKVSELKDVEASSSELHGRIKDLTDALSSKEQEIEGMMQALDVEEKEIEVLENRNNELENMLLEKEHALKDLEISRTKAFTKLETTISKFDELHNLSESLIAEVENLQSQLQGRDSEISFLRQEVTRSTNELLATEEINKKYSSQIHDFLKWLETTLMRFGMHYDSHDDYDCSQSSVYMDMLEKKIGSVISELDELQITVQSKDSLLQIERGKLEELLRKSEVLEASISQRESQIELLRRDRIPGQPSRAIDSLGTLEIEQVKDKLSPGAVGTLARGGRKVNNDQVAIAIETEDDKALDDEDDDKAHGFKSLTMSRFVPKFTRPITDRIDGMWVSGDRLLMRQPTLRIGVLIYWIALHALLASFI